MFLLSDIGQMIPDNQRVFLFGGPNAGRGGVMSSAFDHTGNGPSAAYAACNVTSNTLPGEHGIITLDDGGYCLASYSDLELENVELRSYLVRAAWGDVAAIRTLGHCLVESNGGVGQDLANGGYWIAVCSTLFGDPYSTAWFQAVRGQGDYPNDPPAFDTMHEVEEWWGA